HPPHLSRRSLRSLRVVGPRGTRGSCTTRSPVPPAAPLALASPPDADRSTVLTACWIPGISHRGVLARLCGRVSRLRPESSGEHAGGGSRVGPHCGRGTLCDDRDDVGGGANWRRCALVAHGARSRVRPSLG